MAPPQVESQVESAHWQYPPLQIGAPAPQSASVLQYWHAPPTHSVLEMHASLLVQTVVQESPEQVKVPQLDGEIRPGQTWVPPHRAALAVVPIGRPNVFGGPSTLTQLALAQTWNSAALTVPQAPEPLQVVWQLASVQASCGSDPAGTGQHVPSFPATLQALQPPHEASGLLQQTPSTQWSVVHSLPLPQLAPGDFFATQLGALQ